MPGRRAPLQPGVEGGVGAQRCGELGREVARRDGVALDAVPRPIGAHGLGQHPQRALGRRVGAGGGAAQHAHHGAGVDDLAAAAARDHPPGHGPGAVEGAVQVGGDHRVPGLVRHLVQRAAEVDAGVVEQDVDRAEAVLDRGDAGLHAEALSAAELMHGPLTLAGPKFPVLVFSQHDEAYQSVADLITALSARGVPVIAAGSAPGNCLTLPADPSLNPFVTPLALIQSFYPLVEAVARMRGRDPDNPPHLKKVTETV